MGNQFIGNGMTDDRRSRSRTPEGFVYRSFRQSALTGSGEKSWQKGQRIRFQEWQEYGYGPEILKEDDNSNLFIADWQIFCKESE